MSQLAPLQTTVQDLCTAAAKESGALGIGQTLSAEDITDAWARLQWMLQEWGEDPFLVWREQTITVQSVNVSLMPTDPNQGTPSNPVYYFPVGPGAGALGGMETGQNTGWIATLGAPTAGSGGVPGTYVADLTGGSGCWAGINE